MTLALLALFVAATALFVVVEKKAKDPILHLELFRNPVFLWANIAGFFLRNSHVVSQRGGVPGRTVYAVGARGPGHQQRHRHPAALMIGAIVTATLAERMVSRTGRCKP